ARISPALDAARCVLVLAVGLRLWRRPAALRSASNGSAICALHLLSSPLGDRLQPAAVHLGEAALPAEQFVTGAELDEAAVVDDGDAVGDLDRREAMRDHDRGAVGEQAGERPLDEPLAREVEGRRGL